MKTTVIITISANGKILVADNEKHQAPQEVFNFFMDKAKSAGNIILGSTTYKLFTTIFGLKDFLSALDVVVLSNKLAESSDYKVARSPKEALDFLKANNHQEAIVLGGVSVYNSFINEGLYDLLYLTLIPILIGDGGDIATKNDLFTPLSGMKWEVVTDNVLRVELTK
ncbi:dihydrofolate reductase family protein [Pedobacter terrae]|nr:dihydrofolate reductase [Pedobacter terrae]